jgi:glutamyl-tRNA reductase
MLSALPGIEEAIILSTCNRVEIYSNVKEPATSFATVRDFLSRFHGLDTAALERSLYLHRDQDAVRHIFRVASSLDSMVVGEPQILGQLKDAFEFALGKKCPEVIPLRTSLAIWMSTGVRVREAKAPIRMRDPSKTRILESIWEARKKATSLGREIFSNSAFFLR